MRDHHLLFVMPNAEYIKLLQSLSYVPYWLQNRTEPNQARDGSWWNVASRTNCAYSYCGRRLMTVAPLYAGIGGKGVGGVEVEVVVGVVGHIGPTLAPEAILFESPCRVHSGA